MNATGDPAFSMFNPEGGLGEQSEVLLPVVG